MDYISQFANAELTQQRMDENPKLKSLAMQICHEFNLRVSNNKKEAHMLSLLTDNGLPVGNISVIKDYRNSEFYYEITMPDIISKDKSSARSDRNSRDSDKVATLIKSIKKNKEIPTIDKLTKNYLQCLFYALSRVGEARKPDISIHQDVALSAIKYALGIDTMGVQLHTAKLQEIYNQYMKEVNELSNAKSNQDRYLKGCTAIGIVGGRWSDSTLPHYLVGNVGANEDGNLAFQGNLTRYATLTDTEHAPTAAMIRTYMQGHRHGHGEQSNELGVPWSDHYYDEIDIATGYTGNTGLWVLIPKHAE
jgi:hypothetical protein